MSKLVVLGGGFAGVWAAASAVRVRQERGLAPEELTVTVVSAGDDLVIRPRLYESDPERMRVSLDRVLGPIGVRRVAATVTGIDPAGRQISAIGRDSLPVRLDYDRLVLATGSQLVRPSLAGAEHLFDVDTLPGAARLDAHLHRLPDRPPSEGRFTAVVVGGGFTGLELATELADRLAPIAGRAGAGERPRVVLLDRSAVVGSGLGEGPRPQIEQALRQLGVQTRLRVSVAAVEPDGVRLDDGTWLAAHTVVWSAGMTASPLTGDIPGERDALGRLVVDEYLRVPAAPEVFAAGDTAAALAEPGHPTMQSCQHAMPLGRSAGHNAAADLLGADPVQFVPLPYVTCLDLGSAGAVFTNGWERRVELSGAAGKRRKRTINQQWIYPPTDNATELLRQADLTHQYRPTAPAAQ